VLPKNAEGRQLSAYIVPAVESDLNEMDMIQGLVPMLPDYMIPDHYYFLKIFR